MSLDLAGPWAKSLAGLSRCSGIRPAPLGNRASRDALGGYSSSHRRDRRPPGGGVGQGLPGATARPGPMLVFALLGRAATARAHTMTAGTGATVARQKEASAVGRLTRPLDEARKHAPIARGRLIRQGKAGVRGGWSGALWCSSIPVVRRSARHALATWRKRQRVGPAVSALGLRERSSGAVGANECRLA